MNSFRHYAYGMNITEERLQEFQEAYKIDFGEEITTEQARVMLFRVTTLYELLLQPVPEDAKEKAAKREL